jgi:hypothetical protein
VIEAVNRAMIGLDAYWSKHGTPDPRVIAQVHAKLEEKSAACDDDWQALLVDAMRDLGYEIEVHGEEVQALTQSVPDAGRLFAG